MAKNIIPKSSKSKIETSKTNWISYTTIIEQWYTLHFSLLVGSDPKFICKEEAHNDNTPLFLNEYKKKSIAAPEVDLQNQSLESLDKVRKLK